jgi:hypothetical protein
MYRTHWLRFTGAVAAVAALVIAGIGCSGSSTTAPTENQIRSSDPMLDAGPEIGAKQDFPFEFTSRIAKLAPDDNLIVLKDKELVVRITKDTKAQIGSSQFRTDFRFEYVKVGYKVTVYGTLLKDNSVVAGLIEIYPESSATTDSSN